MRYDRAQVATYTPVMYTSQCALIAVAEEASVNAFSYFFVFDWEVWAGLVACIPLVSVALAFIEKRRRRNGNSFALEVYDNTWDILRSFSYEGHTAPTKSHAGRLLFSLWWLTVLVLTNGFAGQLKASMAIKSEPPRFRSAEEITFRPEIRPLIWKDTGFEAYVRTSTRPSLRALTRQVYRHGGFASISEMYSQVAMQQLYSGRAVIISDQDVSMHMLAKQCRLTGGRLYVAPELLFTRFLTVAHAQGMKPSLVRRIHGKMRAIMESGLHLKWYNDGVEDWHRCQAMQGAGTSQANELSFKVLRYDDMAAVFSLWAIMAAISLCVFLAEVCFHGWARGRSYRLARIGARRNKCRRLRDSQN
ncbi:glutamate receptor ionotropic, delta-2-like [Amblyomma americanum]